MPPQTKTDPYASIAEDPYSGIAEGVSAPPPPSGNTKKMIKEPASSIAKKVAVGSTLGAFQGLGIEPGASPKEVIEGTFKNLGQGAKNLLVQAWEANAPKLKYDPLSYVGSAAMTGLDLVPTFIIDTANQLEQNERDFRQAIQQKDWEKAAELASQSVTTLAMLKHGAEKPESLTENAAKRGLGDRAHSFSRRVTEATRGTKEAVEKAISDQTEKLAKNREERFSTVKKNLERQREARQKIDQQKIKIKEQNEKITDQNREQAEAVSRRMQLERQVDQESADLGKDIDKLENSVYKQANENFDAVRAKIGKDVQASPDALIATVKDVEKNTLQDIPENVKEFRRILSLENTSAELTKLRDDVMAGQGMQGMKYEDLSSERKALVDDIVNRLGVPENPSEPLTWDKLQSLKSRLDTRLRNGRGLNGDLKRALFKVRDQVVDEMGKMAESAGVGQQWEIARDFYRQWREDFHEATGPSGSGSPVAQARDAVDPSKIRQPFLRTQSSIGNRGIDILKKYPQFGGDAIAEKAKGIIAKDQEASRLPDKISETPLKPTPEAFKLPKNKEAPKIPGKPTLDLEAVAREKIAQTAMRVGRLNAWDARIIASSVIAGVLAPFIGLKGGVELGASYVAMKEFLSRTLDKPKVIEWLARTPQSEIESLNKLPGIDKINVQHGLTEAAIDLSKKKFTLSPELRRFLGPSNVARIAAVNSSVQRQKKERLPGQQLKDLRTIQQNFTSNPAMPTGETER